MQAMAECLAPPGANSGQGDLPGGGLGVLPVEKRGVADSADAHAAAFIGDLRAQHAALIALRPEKPELHQFVGAEVALQFGEKRRRQSAFAEFQRGLEGLAEAAEKRLLRATS